MVHFTAYDEVQKFDKEDYTNLLNLLTKRKGNDMSIWGRLMPKVESTDNGIILKDRFGTIVFYTWDSMDKERIIELLDDVHADVFDLRKKYNCLPKEKYVGTVHNEKDEQIFETEEFYDEAGLQTTIELTRKEFIARYPNLEFNEYYEDSFDFPYILNTGNSECRACVIRYQYIPGLEKETEQ